MTEYIIACRTCKWYDRHIPLGKNPPKGTVGRCRKNSPVIAKDPEDTQWPYVYAHFDWCGEWEPK
jgi:hypothetical protein